MDILPTEVLTVVTTAFKVLFVIVAGVVVLVSYFQAKEARKMEQKLRIALPGSVGLSMSVQLMLSLSYLILATLFLLLL